ncbi:MAG: GPW/gp25 family protein [Synergistaceae bacterium]|nr:GPW/gp25 family protein [Synergistaceae bacterium]
MITNSEIALLLNADSEINFAPATLEQEIAQNVLTIFLTSKYSVPLDREFGLNMTLVDKPQSIVKALLINEITESLERYEPRIKVTGIEFTGNADGYTKPLIKYIIRQ